VWPENKDIIIEGDCQVILKYITSDSIDMVLTSPPYDNIRDYDSQFDCTTIATELYRILKDGSVVVWVVADATINGSETCSSFKQVLCFKSVGFSLYDTEIYAKVNYIPLTHRRYEQAFEYMFVFSKGRVNTFNPIMVPCITYGTKIYRGGNKSNGDMGYGMRERDEYTLTSDQKQHSNIFVYKVGGNIQSNHPAPFPYELAIDQIHTWSNPGELVLDPFFGSGTTGLVCKELNRHYIGIEISKEFNEDTKTRLNLPGVYRIPKHETIETNYIEQPFNPVALFQ
jgi:DNA modification methylase